MSCCTWAVFKYDYDHHFKNLFARQPTEYELKKARSDWREGNTGYEGARNAVFREKEAVIKAAELPLVHLGGKNYAFQGSNLAGQYGKAGVL